MEGNKKHKKLTRDCLAVSEIIGLVLMIAIVVLAFSAVSLAVFSDGGTMNPPHTPHINLQENINTSDDTVQVFHRGGETIDLEDITIILNVGEEQAEFDMSEFQVLDPEGNRSDDSVFTLGDCIVINPVNSSVDITDGDAINIYVVHTESSQVIQKTVLWIDSGDLPEWITPYPYGSVYDSLGGWQDEELVDKIGDGLLTENEFPQDEYVYENFTFGTGAEELDIPEGTSFIEVRLKVVYIKHDNSPEIMSLKIYNGSQCITIMEELPTNLNTVEMPITEHVKTTAELENLLVQISTIGNAADSADKVGWIDFVGIHLEY
ncbi:type IV pilin [Methanosarcina sp. KYL-1]|uniref:type IV pilin N-terminal domain-containing protein n=1 Tax=Methanosarcina sp. KYL-1 TaxID=2602068 RepID=UPI0021013381|nr:type IV pilin [Methanosarcina sp. KYL-1]